MSSQAIKTKRAEIQMTALNAVQDAFGKAAKGRRNSYRHQQVIRGMTRMVNQVFDVVDAIEEQSEDVAEQRGKLAANAEKAQTDLAELIAGSIAKAMTPVYERLNELEGAPAPTPTIDAQ